MKFLKNLVSVVSISLVLLTGATSVKAAGSATDNSAMNSQTDTQLPVDTQTSQPEAPGNNTPAAPATSNNQPTQSPAQQLSQPLSNQTYQQSTQTYQQTQFSSTSCGTQVTAKGGNNPSGQLEWAVGFTYNIGNPCVQAPANTQQTLSCHQQRVRAMELILNYTQSPDPKTPKKLLSVNELKAYLDTVCVIKE
jgi:hypothetical protein